MILFLDSSALVKLYSNETHTEFVAPLVQRVILSGGRVAVSRLARVEAVSAFARKASEGVISRYRYLKRVNRKLEEDFASVYLVYSTADDVMDFAATIPSPVPEGGRHIPRQHPLRAGDAIQLACALIAAGKGPAVGAGETSAPRDDFLMLTFDRGLHRAAVLERIAHENPDPACPDGARFSALDYP